MVYGMVAINSLHSLELLTPRTWFMLGSPLLTLFDE